MKTKNIIIIILCLCLIAFVPGVTGAVRVYDKSDEGAAKHTKDLMVGMFVTTEYLDLVDEEQYIKDSFNKSIVNGSIDDGTVSGDTVIGLGEPDSGRHYAKLVNKSFTDEETGNYIEAAEYVFEDIEGYGCYSFYVDNGENGYYSRVIDDVFCDCSINSNGFDSLDENIIEATIYYSGDYTLFYINPVYQSTDGKVYVVAGKGMATSGQTSGSSMSTTLKDEITENRNDQLITRTNEVKLTVKCVSKIKRIIINQMNNKNERIKVDSYIPGELPIDYYPESEAEYLIVETVTTDSDGNEKSDRKIVDKSKNWFDTYKTLESGMYRQFSTSVDW